MKMWHGKLNTHKEATRSTHTHKWKERGGERHQCEEGCHVTHWMVWKRVTYLKRWNVRVGNIAVHILDFWKVLLRHMHQLRRSDFIGEPREVVFQRRGIFILIPVLYTGKVRGRNGETEESRENEMRKGRKKTHNPLWAQCCKQTQFKTWPSANEVCALWDEQAKKLP